MAEASQNVSSKLGENVPSVKPTSVPGQPAEVRTLSTKDMVHETLEERKELIGALRNVLENLSRSIQDLIRIDERAMGIYHKELYPKEAAEAQKKYDAALKEAQERQQIQTPK